MPVLKADTVNLQDVTDITIALIGTLIDNKTLSKEDALRLTAMTKLKIEDE